MGRVSPAAVKERLSGDEAQLTTRRGRQERLAGALATRPGRWYCTPARSEACTRLSCARWISRLLSDAETWLAGGIGRSLGGIDGTTGKPTARTVARRAFPVGNPLIVGSAPHA